MLGVSLGNSWASGWQGIWWWKRTIEQRWRMLMSLSLSFKYPTTSLIIDCKSDSLSSMTVLSSITNQSHTHTNTNNTPLWCSFMIHLIDAGVQVRSANQSPCWHLNCLVLLLASCRLIYLISPANKATLTRWERDLVTGERWAGCHDVDHALS